MSYQALIQELLDPKKVEGQNHKRAPNSLEIRAAKAIYSLLIDLKNLNEKLVSQTQPSGTDSSVSTGSSSEAPGSASPL
jgi:hypothetical protein